MTKENVLKRLTEIFRDVFDNGEIVISEDTKQGDLEGWDSLNHIMLLSAVESEFGIEFDMDTVQNIKSVGDMIDQIMKANI